ncbi:hypothetical protein, partial [Streptomyces sp. NPDC056632]|uniref:hypothetical protein n=1 Tax=Streptomyces sp. NPDC056632 TaxID=3345884 RepID=UPI0036C965BB
MAWPEPPAGLTVGPKLQELRDAVDAFIYDPEQTFDTDDERAGTALLISLTRTPNDLPINRSAYQTLRQGFSWSTELLGLLKAVGAFVNERIEPGEESALTPSQMGDIIPLKEPLNGLTITSHAAASKIWGPPRASTRRIIVQGVWAGINWHSNGVLRLFAEAVIEIADQLRRNNMPAKTRTISNLIWRDDRADAYQDVVVKSILREREGGPFRRLRSRVKGFTYDSEGQYATDRDRGSAALLISLKNASGGPAIARSNYLSKLTKERNGSSADAHISGMFRGVGAFSIKRKKSDEDVMTSSQLWAVMSLHGKSTEKGSPVSSVDAVKLVWGSSIEGNVRRLRRHLVEGVWAMMNWNDGDVFQDFADAVVDIARQMQDDEEPIDERGIAKLIWADGRAIEDQVVIVHAILRARGVVEEEAPPTTSPEQAVLDVTDTQVDGSETAGASPNPVQLEEGEDALAAGVGQLGITATSPTAERTETGGGLTRSLHEVDPNVDVSTDTDTDLITPGPEDEQLLPGTPVPLSAPSVIDYAPSTAGDVGGRRTDVVGTTSTPRLVAHHTGTVPPAANTSRDPVSSEQTSTDPATVFKDWLTYELVEKPPENAPIDKLLTFLVHDLLSVAESGIWHTAREVVNRLRGNDHIVSPDEESLFLGLLQGLALPHVYRSEWATGPGTADEMYAVLTAVAQATAGGQAPDRDSLVRTVLPHATPALRAQATGWAMAADLLHATGDVRFLITATQQLHLSGDTADIIIATLLHAPRPTEFQRKALEFWLTYTNTRTTRTTRTGATISTTSHPTTATTLPDPSTNPVPVAHNVSLPNPLHEQGVELQDGADPSGVDVEQVSQEIRGAAVSAVRQPRGASSTGRSSVNVGGSGSGDGPLSGRLNVSDIMQHRPSGPGILSEGETSRPMPRGDVSGRIGGSMDVDLDLATPNPENETTVVPHTPLPLTAPPA